MFLLLLIFCASILAYNLKFFNFVYETFANSNILEAQKVA